MGQKGRADNTRPTILSSRATSTSLSYTLGKQSMTFHLSPIPQNTDSQSQKLQETAIPIRSHDTVQMCQFHTCLESEAFADVKHWALHLYLSAQTDKSPPKQPFPCTAIAQWKCHLCTFVAWEEDGTISTALSPASSSSTFSRRTGRNTVANQKPHGLLWPNASNCHTSASFPPTARATHCCTSAPYRLI